MHYKHNSNLTNNARNLRKNGTKEENHLWYDFLRHYPVRFLRQKVIDDYIVDFYCAKAKLAIELDGSQHYEEKGLLKDKIRTEHLEKRNIQVIRIPNNEVNKNWNNVCEYIDNLVTVRLTSVSHNAPLVKGERAVEGGEGIPAPLVKGERATVGGEGIPAPPH